MKLSQAQSDMLYMAYLKRGKDATYQNPDAGWFYPNRYETAAVWGTVPTAAALCGKGLLEYKTVQYVQKKGHYEAINQYRITDNGAAEAQRIESSWNTVTA